MSKGQTMMVGHDGVKKINEGDIVFAIQGNFDEDRKGMMVNCDWSFTKDMTPSELKACIGGFLASVGELYGTKLLAAAMMHALQDLKNEGK